jgi:hypothetical protein
MGAQRTHRFAVGSKWFRLASRGLFCNRLLYRQQFSQRIAQFRQV